MPTNINIAGRLHSVATGNVVSGADEVLDDNLAEKQDVINGKLTVKTSNILLPSLTFAEQVTDENTLYIIKDTFDLEGEEVTIPEGCALQFQGGKIANGSCVLQNTFFDGAVQFGDSVTFSGTCANVAAKGEWFTNDDSFLSLINNVAFTNIIFDSRTYEFSAPVSLPSACMIEGNSAIIKRADADNSASLCLFDCQNIDYISINNVIFDGSYSGTVVSSTSTIVTPGIKIDGCPKVTFNNVKIQNFNIKTYEASLPGYDIALLNITDYDLAEINSLQVSNVAVNGELMILAPADEIIYAGTEESRAVTSALTCKAVITNSYINGTYWSPVQVWGNLVFTGNQIDFSSGSTLNAFCHTANIENNIFNGNLKSFVIDFVESSQNPLCVTTSAVISRNRVNDSGGNFVNCAYCRNVLIEGNYFIGKISEHPSSTLARIVEMPAADGVVIRDNIFEGFFRFTSTDNNDTKGVSNLVIDNNTFTCNPDSTNNLMSFTGNVSKLRITNNTFTNYPSRYHILISFMSGDISDVAVAGNIANTKYAVMVDMLRGLTTASYIPTVSFMRIENNLAAAAYIFANNTTSSNISIVGNNFHTAVNIPTDQYRYTNLTVDNIKDKGGYYPMAGDVLAKMVVIDGTCGYKVFSVGETIEISRGTLFYISGFGLIYCLTNGELDTTNIESLELRVLTDYNGIMLYRISGHANSYTRLTLNPLNVVGAAEFPTENLFYGRSFYNTQMRKWAIWNGSKWIESDGVTAGTARLGDTASRPALSDIYYGFMYFDTTLGKPIWRIGTTAWVDATGATV